MRSLTGPALVVILLIALAVPFTWTIAPPPDTAITVNPGSARAASPEARPNIIFILTDDQDTKSVAFMPRLKTLLIDQGTTFSNFFVTYSLCCPSRSSILRGQYPHNHQVLSNTPPNGGFLRFHNLGNENSTVATWLQGAGYRTALMGKYLNGYPVGVQQTYVPPGWDEWDSPIGNGGYANYNYTLNENGRLVRHGNGPDDYLTDLLARRATDFIRRTVRESRPFFIYLATYAPHEPATPAPRHQNEFPNARMPRSPSFNEADVSDKPEWIRNLPALSPQQIGRIEEHYRKRLQSLQAVDDLLATLVNELQALGQLGRTYIFFSSDNGFHMGEHRLPMGKNTAYEEDIRVPLIVRGPGIPEGRTLPHLTLNIDFAPTWADLAGASAAGFVDGRSLVPLLGGSPPAVEAWRQTFLVEHYPAGEAQAAQARPRRRPGGRGLLEFQAARARDFLYVEYATGERELYDLRNDPYELQSLHASVEAALMRQLASYLAALRRCAAASCRSAEDAPAPAVIGR